MLRLYPEYQQEFSNDIQHDLTFNLREGYEAEAEESDMNAPSLAALPSISEDDENQSDTEHAGSPRTAALLRSPLLMKSPRRKFLQRESSLTTLRERVERQRSVTVKSEAEDDTDSKSLEGLNLEKSGSYQDVVNCSNSLVGVVGTGGPKQYDRLDSLHQDVAALSIEVRNAIQALQEVTYSRMASNVQLCGFPPARSIPNLCGGLGSSVGVGVDTEIVRSSSHPPEMWGREMGIFAMHPENPFQADIDAAAAVAAALQQRNLLTTVNSVATQTEVVERDGDEIVGGKKNGKLPVGKDLMRIVEETILTNPDLLLLLVRKNESFAQSAQMRRLAMELIDRTAASEEHPNGSKVVDSSSSSSINGSSRQQRGAHKTNYNSNNMSQQTPSQQAMESSSKAASIINNSVQYYEEAEQKLLSVKNKLRRKLSSEKVRRRNHYNDSSSRVNGPPAHRFSAGDAELAEPDGVRANQSTRSLKDN